MSTLEEILEGTSPGVKVITLWETRDIWFCPVFKDANGIYYGTNQSGVGTFFSGDSQGWRLWQEPETKVTKWLWTDMTGANLSHFLTDEEAAIENRNMRADAFTVKLCWSAMEFKE